MDAKKHLPFAVHWFTFEDLKTFDLVLNTLKNLKIRELRTAFSWADYERPGGKKWFDFFKFI